MEMKQAPEKPAALRILLVEDDPSMAELVRAGLRYEGFDVIAAADGLDGIQQARDASPDLVVLDWMLPGADGVTVCRRIKQMGDTPVIMLTARDAVQDRVSGLDAGADDYLIKPFSFDELLARIRARLRKRLVESGNTLVFADLTLDLDQREAARGGRSIHLTATEFNVLQHLLRHPRKVLSKEAILEAVWGYTFDGEANIVEQYIRSLRQKLGEPQLIHTVRQAGYILREA